MDEMEIKGKFLRSIISGIITKTLKKKLGKEIEINVNNIKIKTGGLFSSVHLDADISILSSDLKELLYDKIGL